jgi:hypothetical protein
LLFSQVLRALRTPKTTCIPENGFLQPWPTIML